MSRGPSGRSAGAPTGERGLNQRAYEEIRRQILAGELQPASPLSEHQLAATLQLSRTPVREAIKRLEKEGLVRSIPSRGTFIAELSAQDILEIYQLRGRLEGLAARIAAEQMTSEELRALEQEVALIESSAAEDRASAIQESDIRFHKLIIGATQNRRLGAILAMFDDQMHRIRAILPGSSDWLEGTLREHRAIFEAIKARDPDKAERAIEEHLRASCERAVRVVLPLSLTARLPHPQ
jgi:DNA-binding GntR family transcriptional regulator